MDAGARGRRLLQRREYAAKISGSEDRVPDDIRDWYNLDGKDLFDENKIGDSIIRGLDASQRVFDRITTNQKTGKKNVLGKVTDLLFKSKNPGGQYGGAANPGKGAYGDSFEPEGEMVEANAQQQAMHDAKLKKMEDDKVAAKKKKINEKKHPDGKHRAKVLVPDGQPRSMKVHRLGGPRMAQGMPTYDSALIKAVMDKRKQMAKKKKETKEEVQLEAKKSCGEGEYYCHDMKKCKPIPDGMKVGKDGMLVKEDMKGMSQKSGDKRSTVSGAGMTAKGVAKYNRRTGGNLKTAVTTPPSKLKPGSKAAKRRKSFCARSRSWTGPRGKAARRRWNCSYEPELPMIIDEKKKLYNGAPLSDRVAAWANKISEGSPLTPGRNEFGLPTGLKSGTRGKNTEKKVNPKNLPVAMASYEPQGDMIEMATFSLDDFEKSPKKYYDLTNPRERAEYSRLKKAGKNPLIKKVESVQYVDEQKMTPTQKERKEKYVKGMKKAKSGFTKRYGKDGKSVMYATATKMAMKKEGYGDVPFRDGRVKKYLGGQGEIDKLVNLTQKGKEAFKTIPDPKIFSGNKAINPNNTITNLYRTRDRLNSSYEPEGEMTEAKIDSKIYGKSATGKTTLRNMRRFDSATGHGDSPQRRAETQVRRDEHKKRRGMKTEGSLHSWFKGSKSKDGKPGWVNVVTGGTCASDKPGEGTPKCVSSSKRASMTKAERLSASRRKKKADPGQQSKSGAAKPTYVSTDKKKK